MKHRVRRTTTDKLERDLNDLQNNDRIFTVTPVFQGGRDWTILFREGESPSDSGADDSAAPNRGRLVRVSLSWFVGDGPQDIAAIHAAVNAFGDSVHDICEQEELIIDGPWIASPVSAS